MKTLIGIDPGFSGALAHIAFNENNPWEPPQILSLIDMPLRDELGDLLKTHEDSRQVICGGSLRRFIEEINPTPTMAFIERVASSKQMGVVSAFRFGQGEGLVCGVLEGLEIPYRKITPSVWKLHFGLSSRKIQSLKLIRDLYPKQMQYFKLNKHDGRAEAALLAHFGWQKFHRGYTKSKELTFDDLK